MASSLALVKQIEDLKTMTARELRDKYIEVFGEESRSNNKDYLWRRIAWRLQELTHGGLSQRAKLRAGELANEADLRITPPEGTFETEVNGKNQGHHHHNNYNQSPAKTSLSGLDPRLPAVGTVLTRHYKGKVIVVKILDKGFEFEEQEYRSLSTVAKVATGVSWNGYKFFNLQKRDKRD